MNFWQKLKKDFDKTGRPFFGLAPMLDVTDAPFRAMFAKYGKPDVMWTEFVSADGLCSAGKNKLIHMLKYSEKERPIVAQIFGANPETIKQAAALIEELGFDGLDINMGCPDRSVLKQGAGAALIKTPKLAQEIIRAARAGAPNIPLSIKTRVGFDKEEINQWIPILLQEDISAITIHARTKKELSKVPANWDYVKRVVDLVKKGGKEILVIGNGDILNIKDGIKKSAEIGCEGIMIGRGAFGNPWLFNINKKEISTEEKLKALLEHTKLFEKILGKVKNFAVMKKHYKAYVNGFDGAKELRIKLMETNSYDEVRVIIKDFLKSLVK